MISIKIIRIQNILHKDKNTRFIRIYINIMDLLKRIKKTVQNVLTSGAV